MDLKKYMTAHRQELTVWGEFNGIEIELEYTDRREMNRILESCKRRAFNPRTHQPVEEYDDELFNKKLSEKIRDWKGLTLGKLAEMTNIDIGGEDPHTVVPCTPVNREVFVAEVYGANNWVRETITDIQEFRAARQETEIKNSRTSQGKAQA